MSGFEREPKSIVDPRPPIDVAVKEPARRTAAFSLAAVSPRVPSARPARGPRVGVTAVPPGFREAHRELRFALDRVREQNGTRTIAVVSPGKGDGKSLLAVNAARALVAHGSRRVAVVDAAFESPRVAELLDAEAPVGLADVLAGRTSLERALFAAEPKGLFALSAGDPSAIDFDPMAHGDAIRAAIDRLATVFDVVLVDTTALERSIDAAAVASHVDGALLIVRAAKTAAREIERAFDRIGEGKVCGLVLNGA